MSSSAPSTGFAILSGARTWYATSNAAAPKKPAASKVQPKVRAAAKSAGQVIYPIFQEAAALCSDTFWAAILRDLGAGKAPKGYRYHNGLITYKVRTKTYDQRIGDAAPVVVMQDTIRFMKETSGMQSELDTEQRNRERKLALQAQADNEVGVWSSYPQSHRSILIQVYVELITHRHHLSSEQAYQLDETIRRGVMAGYFSSANIQIRGGAIEKIEGLLVNTDEEGKMSFSIDRPRTRRVATKKVAVEDTEEEETKGQQGTPLRRWVKLISALDRRSTKYNHFTSTADAMQSPTPSEASTLSRQASEAP